MKVMPRAVKAISIDDERLNEESEVNENGGFPTASEIIQSSCLPLPSESHQRRLTAFKDIKPLRSAANNLAREERLPRIICGSQGITSNFVIACADILCKPGSEDGNFLRIKLGEGAGVERKEAAKALEALLDALCVFEVGYTITLYRQGGLPRPSNTIKEVSTGPAEESKAAATPPRVRVTAAMRSEAARKEMKGKPKPPPEFEVTS